MKDLSPLAQELLQAGKHATDPTDADRSRNLAAIQARIDAGSLPAASDAPLPAPATPRPSWQIAAGATIGGGLIAGLLYFAAQSPDAHSVPPASKIEEVELEAPADDAADQFDPTESADLHTLGQEPSPDKPKDSGTLKSAPLPAQGSPKASPAPTSSQLAEEVALLSQATSALRSGRGQEALGFLSEHQKRFPQGALSQERRSARAQALCSLGKKDEARSVLRGFSDSSPLGVRAKRACGFSD